MGTENNDFEQLGHLKPGEEKAIIINAGDEDKEYNVPQSVVRDVLSHLEKGNKKVENFVYQSYSGSKIIVIRFTPDKDLSAYEFLKKEEYVIYDLSKYENISQLKNMKNTPVIIISDKSTVVEVSKCQGQT